MILTVGNFRFQTVWKGDILGPVDLSNDFSYIFVNNLFHKYEAPGKEEMTINVFSLPFQRNISKLQIFENGKPLR